MNTKANFYKVYTFACKRWYIILITLLCFSFCAYLYVLLATPLYRAEASIKLEDRKSELSDLITTKNIYDRSSKPETEKFILSSRNVLNEALLKMNLQVSYYVDDHYQKRNLYPLKPMTIKILSVSEGQRVSSHFTFEAINDKEFFLQEDRSENPPQRYAYGEHIHLPGCSLVIQALNTKLPSTRYYFSINQQDEQLVQVSRAFKIEDHLNTNILKLGFTDANPVYAKDMLNAILQQYQQYDRDQRSLSMKQMSFYIDTLLQRMSVVLHKSGIEMQNFKSGHQLLSPSANAEALIQQLTALETEKHQITLRTVLNTHLKKALDKDPGLNTLNFSTANVYDPQLHGLLNKYNALIDKKAEALINYPPTSVIVLHLEKQIANLKLEVTGNIENQNRKDQELLTYLTQQIETSRQGIQSAPQLERNYITLQANFNIHQKVYDYLSEKKLEAEIATAAIIPNAQLIDEAVVLRKPVYPNSTDIYKDFALAGLLCSSLLLFCIHRFDTRLYDAALVEAATTIPVIGALSSQHGTPRQQIAALDQPNSLFAESVRAMRTNLQQLVLPSRCTVICITSAIAGEGKSFTSLNVAGTLCLINKRVLVIATDLRKSSLHDTFGLSNEIGLSNYLSGKISADQLRQSTRFPTLDFIAAGPGVSNPAEILQSPLMPALVSALKKEYDVIILDTAPVSLVADSIPLMCLADLNLFVLRYGVSSINSITLPEKMKKEFNLSHVAIVLNGFKQQDTGHGYYSLSTNRQSYSDYHKAGG